MGDALLTSQVKVALYLDADPDAATAILGANCFPTYGSMRSELMALWATAKELQESQARGVDSLSILERKRVRQANPVPANIGCAYGSTWCTNVEKYGAENY